jgi:hypothetical protein
MQISLQILMMNQMKLKGPNYLLVFKQDNMIECI